MPKSCISSRCNGCARSTGSSCRRETDSTSTRASFEGALVVQEGDCPYRRARKIRSLAELGAIGDGPHGAERAFPRGARAIASRSGLPRDARPPRRREHRDAQPGARGSALRAAFALSALVRGGSQPALRRVGVPLPGHARALARSYARGHAAPRRGARVATSARASRRRQLTRRTQLARALVRSGEPAGHASAHESLSHARARHDPSASGWSRCSRRAEQLQGY